MNEGSPKLDRRDAILTIAAAAAGLALGRVEGAVVKSGGDAMEAQLKSEVRDAAAVTPKVVKVKLENDRVRVLEYTSEPGDREDWHSHPAFVVYITSGGTLRMTTPDGKATDAEFQPGDIKFREPLVHKTENVGKTTIHGIIVELKSPSKTP
jgi:quercetin dioxygenase-like cupin family protein